MEDERGPYTMMNKPTNVVYCHQCGVANGQAQFVAIAWPDGRVREAWLHLNCEEAYLKRLTAEI